MGRHSSRDRSRHRKHSSHRSSRHLDYSESRERYRDRDDDRSRERYRDEERRERHRHSSRHHHRSSQEKISSYSNRDDESDAMSGIITSQSEVSASVVTTTTTTEEITNKVEPSEISTEESLENKKNEPKPINPSQDTATVQSTVVSITEIPPSSEPITDISKKMTITQPSTTNTTTLQEQKIESVKPITLISTISEPKKEEKEPINDILRQRRERMEQWKKIKQKNELEQQKKLEEKKLEEKKQEEKKSTILEDKKQPNTKDTPKSSLSFNLNSTTINKTPATTTSTKIGFKSKIKLNPIKKAGSFVLKPKVSLKRPNVLKQFSLIDDRTTSDEKPKIKKIKLLDKIDDVKDSKPSSNDTSSAMDVDKPDDEMKEDEVDALDAYMKDVRKEVEEIKKQDELSLKQNNEDSSKTPFDAEQEDNEYTTEEEDEEDILALAAKKLAKRKDLIAVDHSTIQYEPFRKNFYIEPPELAGMKQAEVEQVRRELDNIKVQGHRCPKPVRKWTQFGLPTGCLEVIKKVLKYQQPSPIQCQAIPAIMSGRDVISVAKTGSGKTIAFLLPMFRAIKDQRPLEPQEGPIALIMTPTRELAVQIYKECRHFTRVLGLNVTCAYGGSPIKDQIAELKKGAEIIVCTPGRMIDLLCANSGRVTNLRRVTYLVLDEADRMFDMGFEPQVMKIVNNIRPDRQTLLFSATFPRQIDALARKILTKPLEITVGGKSVVCEDVEQHVEVREEDTKFRRLLEILGLYYKQDLNPRTLVFVDRQEAADNLLRELIRFGYPCQSLHGGKDQADRDSTIADFKSGVTNILIATSVAARGLDVKDLNLVINYECPNHLEDYVHRVGRTGRAGNKGTAYTFVTPQQDKYANDIVSALKMSHTDIPPELQKLADEFTSKVKAGDAHYSSSGFGGKGLERLDKERENSKKLQRKIHGVELDDEDEDNTEDEEEKLKESIDAKITDVSAKPSTSTTTNPTNPTMGTENKLPTGKGIEADKIKAVQEIAALVNAKIDASVKAKKMESGGTTEAKVEPALIKPATETNTNENSSLYAFEIEINDYPQKARWRVTNKDQITMITELTGAAITTRGTFFPSGKQPGPNERKLYLFIEGETQLIVDKAKTEIKRILTEATLSCIEAESRGTGSEATGRYTVI